MGFVIDAWLALVVAVAGWMNKGPLEIIEYLRAENRVLREQVRRTGWWWHSRRRSGLGSSVHPSLRPIQSGETRRDALRIPRSPVSRCIEAANPVAATLSGRFFKGTELVDSPSSPLVVPRLRNHAPFGWVKTKVRGCRVQRKTRDPSLESCPIAGSAFDTANQTWFGYRVLFEEICGTGNSFERHGVPPFIRCRPSNCRPSSPMVACRWRLFNGPRCRGEDARFHSVIRHEGGVRHRGRGFALPVHSPPATSAGWVFRPRRTNPTPSAAVCILPQPVYIPRRHRVTLVRTRAEPHSVVPCPGSVSDV